LKIHFFKPISKLKKEAIFFIFILGLSASFVDCTSAQAVDYIEKIENPVAGEIINGNSVYLNVSVTNTGFILTEVLSINYNVNLDGKLCHNESQTLNTREAGFSVHTTVTLTNLTQGKHTIKVDIGVVTATFSPILRALIPSSITNEKSAEVTFFVYQGILPQLSILGSDVYETNQTTFNVTANEPDAVVSYSLDGGVNVTLPQNESTPFQDSYVYNITLMGLIEGSHTLTAYVTDVFNHTAVAQKTFTVGQALSFSTIAVSAGATIAVVVCVVALLWFRKSKRKRQTASLKAV
jgi:hypothetical protein